MPESQRNEWSVNLDAWDLKPNSRFEIAGIESAGVSLSLTGGGTNWMSGAVGSGDSSTAQQHEARQHCAVHSWACAMPYDDTTPLGSDAHDITPAGWTENKAKVNAKNQ
ncbi:MAG: hypothetical protein AAGF84_05910 [Planctomycetota bacterium]